MINRILVANRGEIARRVFATCRRLGISTVAVYTDPDTAAPHVAEADARVRLPGTDGYLDIDAILAAARATGADAIHPGYGFLSENAEFATAVEVVGLRWIGPPAEAVRAMGSKIESKKMMAAAGVPVLDELDPDTITGQHLPVLVKASAGGGGRGMRVVTSLADLEGEVAAAGREAQSAFGDPTVFCERYLPTGHHIEVQVMADTHGTVWPVGERECSIQRRHQKIIEEAPSPLVERVPDMRERLFEAARLAAGTIGYTGAGTVEFLASDQGEFYFLEMNTRLQVEHPVTEATTGLDLVELQIRVAEGDRLDPQPPPTRGHAIEARLYAEDPARNWQPQAGTVHRVDVARARAHFESDGRDPQAPVVRLDSGVLDGSQVSIHYDPMLAKVISYAPQRERAVRALADALARARVHGVGTNRDLLVNVLRHPAFLDGETDTAFFDTHGLTELAAPLIDDAGARLCAVAAALADAAANRAAARVLAGLPGGWRNVGAGDQVKTYRSTADTEYRIRYRHCRTGVALPDDEGVRVVSATAERVVLAEPSGAESTYDVSRYGARTCVDTPAGGIEFSVVPRFVEPGSTIAKGSLVAPMPGLVIRVGTEAGAEVSLGQPLIWLEAMKMEHTLTAPADGVLAELHVGPGDQVDVGAVLARVDTPEP
ncbi:acetyl/propionyl/methylcrotonyl-CoA carboxylase subunit alpha [Mycolicibacterium palauense]|uniref:acetyl/propionyl/methylcrotonyl-CoA carboxylase subunit alpha n=1 Tax=Mycolicibacterium palauense TaxID=2034511 RepID=UPI000BFEC45D|nr:biotin carboxylase N-terminal domain-containing protein [Mycolicibacterium palauense]